MAGYKTIAVACHKGGVGKTTVAMMIADGLQRNGYQVLVVDMDPQGSATAWESKSVEAYASFPVRVEQIYGLSNAKEFARWIEKRTEGIDFLILDTPPRKDATELKIALYISDMVIVPFVPHTATSDALEKLEPIFEQASEDRGDPLDIRILINMYMPSHSSHRAVIAGLPELVPYPIFEAQFKHLAAFGDAYNYRTSIYSLPKRGSGDARKSLEGLMSEILA